MIYLDNAATSFPKPACVITEMDRCMREYCANPGRGGHYLSLQASMAVTNARNTVCKLFNISDPMRLAFTKNATEALNIAIKSLASPECHIITTPMEHNAVMRPLRTLERDMGIELSVVRGGIRGEVDPDDIKREIKSNTTLIICTLSSNVNGIIMPVAEIGRLSRQYGTAFLVDASQGAGSVNVDVEAQCIDMLAFPGHKGLLGPQGTGGLYVREGIRLKTLMEGGTGSNSEYIYQPEMMPDMLESGTLNTPGIVGLGAGAGYVGMIGTEIIHEYKNRLVRLMIDGLSQIPGVILYSDADIDKNSGIVAMNIAEMDSSELSNILDKDYGILTRAGLHCSPAAHRTLGTLRQGIVRFSFGCFNTENDVFSVLEAVARISYNAGFNIW